MGTSIDIKPNTFYIKKSVDTDASVRAYYGDTYDGQSVSGDISTSVNQKFYLAKTTAPAIPQYGANPSLNSLYLKYYPTTVSSSNALSNPRLKVYKMKDNLPLTEGNLDVIDENVSAFCSFTNWEDGWIAENFSGINKGFSDRADYHKSVGTGEGIGGGFGGDTYYIDGEDYDDFLSNAGYYSYKYLGAHGLDNKTYWWGYFVLQQRANSAGALTEKYYPVGQIENPRVDTTLTSTLSADSSLFGDKWAMSKSKMTEYNGFTLSAPSTAPPKTYTIYDTEFTGRVSQFNSIFNFVSESPDAEDIKVQTVGTTGDDDKFYTYSRFLFNPSDKLTGENAGQITQLWENYSGSDTAYGKYFETTTSGTALPQSVHASIDFFPQPANIDTGGPHGTSFGQYMSIAAKEVEFSLKFEKMAPVSTVSGTNGKYNFMRGFSIIFAEEVPTKSDNFVSYLNRIIANAGGGDNAKAATGLFFFKERSSASTTTTSGTYITAFGFLDKAKDGALPITNADGSKDVSDGDFAYSVFNNSDLGSSIGPVCELHVPENEWFTLRFKFEPGNTNILTYCPDVLNPNGAMISGNLSVNTYPKTNGRITDLNCISIWANNFRAVGAYNATLQPLLEPDDDGYKTDDMEQSILIDSIVLRNFNNEILNASVNAQNYPTGIISIKDNLTVPQYSGTTDGQDLVPVISGHLGTADNYYGSQNTPTPVNLCFGFETLPPQITSSGEGASLLFNNYYNVSLAPEHISYIKGSYSDNAGVGVSGQTTVAAGGASVAATAGYFNISGGTSSIDRFTQKGFMGISGAFANATKRENIFCAARVIGVNARGTEIIVDNPSIFDMPLGSGGAGGTDYIMWMLDNPQTTNPREYIDNYAFLSASGSIGFDESLYQIQPRNGTTIYLNRNTRWTDNGKNSMASSNPFVGSDVGYTASNKGGNKPRLGSIFISPKKYWFNIHLVCGKGTTWGEWFDPLTTTIDSLYESVSARSYGSVLLVSGMNSSTATGTIGSTYNEYLFSDGLNQREWSLKPDEGGLFEVNTDYGFGVFTAATEEVPVNFGGYIVESYPESGTFNYANLSSYIEIASPNFDDSLNFSLYPFFEDSNISTHYTINVDNREGTNPVQLIWGIEDKIPIVSDLTATPFADVANMEDPLSESNTAFSDVQLDWVEEGKDMWYRMLFVDTKPIADKYHQARFWAPLNESGTTHKYKYASTLTSATFDVVSGTLTGDIEGFQGYGANFDGATKINTYPKKLGNLGLNSINSFTCIVHCVPSSSAGTILDLGAAVAYTETNLRIYISGSKVYTEIREASGIISGNTTTSYACDGVQPLAIVLTYNKKKDSNHFELYVNNRLEDAISVTNASTIFSIGNGYLYIGGIASGSESLADSGDTGYFSGFIEEITMYNKAYYVAPNNGEYMLDTTPLVDQISGKSNSHQAKLFVFDYHNIRGKSNKQVAESNQVSWGVTAV